MVLIFTWFKLSFNFYFKKSPRDSHFYGTPVLICYKVIAPVKVLVNMDREIVCIPMQYSKSSIIRMTWSKKSSPIIEILIINISTTIPRIKILIIELSYIQMECFLGNLGIARTTEIEVRITRTHCSSTAVRDLQQQE